jgi:hypothetical protein
MTDLTVYIMFWLVLVILGISNGVIREKTYGRYLTELQAHQLSTVTGIIAMTVAVWLLALFIRPRSLEMAIIIGVIWLSLTVAFEFGFGHLVAGHSWERLLADYNLFRGRLWSLLLLWILFLPSLVYMIS